VSQAAGGTDDEQADAGHHPTCEACGHPIVEREAAHFGSPVLLIHGACKVVLSALVSGLLEW
jgi:hypothetical protein